MGSSVSKASLLPVLLLVCSLLLVRLEHPGSSGRLFVAEAAVAATPNTRLPFFAPNILAIHRGGADSTTTTTRSSTSSTTTELSLDEKVQAAMRKLGMAPPVSDDDVASSGGGEERDCRDGVCAIRPSSTSSSSTTGTTTTGETTDSQDPIELANRLASELGVAVDLALAAVGATATMDNAKNTRILSETAARDLIQQELDLIDSVPQDAPHVQTLVGEGHDSFLARRALVYSENNIDDARAILLAELEDQQAEEEDDEKQQQQQQQTVAEGIKMADLTPELISVKGGDFDPTGVDSTSTTSEPTTLGDISSTGYTAKASIEPVVFEATTAQIQDLVLNSPVPVLLDIYADWCGPCKVLGPALEEMARKGGGMFRLVKVNSDNERPISEALEVSALPTVFGVRDGKIVHMFQGMPKSEDMMKNFMMGLFGAAKFSPPVTSSELEKYEELTKKLMKTAGAASFSFSARERLTDRISDKLDELVKDDSVADVEGAATLMRTLLSNIIKSPFDVKYRTIKLDNKVIASKIGTDNASCLAVLRSVGFSKQSPTELRLGGDKKTINIAPLVVARDCIDKWIQRNRAEMAAAARRRKDEIDRARLLAEREASGYYDNENEGDEIDDEDDVDPTACTLKLRLDGKKKVHEVKLHQDDKLSKVLEALEIDSDDEIQITCVAKRLVVKSSDQDSMQKSLKDHGLMPMAALVVKVGTSETSTNTSSLKGRAAGRKERKKGSHTMQSIGIYAKDDHLKGELIDGGAGALYEQDVSDDEDETQEEKGDSNNTDGGEDEQ